MRKGQITMFLIFGIIALAVFSITFYNPRSAPIIPTSDDFKPEAEALVRECAQKALEESLVTVGSIGDADSGDTEYLDDNVAVMLRDGVARLPAIPSYEKQIASNAVSPFQNCLDEAGTEYEITWDVDVSFKVLLGDAVIMTPITQFKLVTPTKTTFITGGAGIVQMNFPLAYSALLEYLNESRNDINLVPITPLLSSHLTYDLVRYPDETYLVNITDTSSEIEGKPWNWRVALVYPEVTP